MQIVRAHSRFLLKVMKIYHWKLAAVSESYLVAQLYCTRRCLEGSSYEYMLSKVSLRKYFSALHVDPVYQQTMSSCQLAAA